VFGIAVPKRKCSLKKLHAASWLVKSQEHLDSFFAWVEGESLLVPEVRMDPVVDRAVELLVFEGLLIKDDGKIMVTDDGIKAIGVLNGLDVFVNEVEALKKAKKYLSEAGVDRLFKV